MTVAGLHLVVALHGADVSFQHDAAGVGIVITGSNIGFLSDHALAVYFLLHIVGIGNDPVTIQQLGRGIAQVGNSDGISEDKAFQLGLRLVIEIGSFYRNGNGLCSFHGQSIKESRC